MEKKELDVAVYTQKEAEILGYTTDLKLEDVDHTEVEESSNNEK
ncbi:hypothetical protein [Veillonella seminalis]|uniref:Uncharacterized protein n=1 Tax=Veillonella seminalis ACS-216-V-Col6b TaxID=883156 RepID=K9CZH4_9FIRM|nr:hypothetical protein [Veillonella seminalis]EKU77393.1 hypothetical protein HMPREF9282_02110 [Veillonella seminalis ACS-216-V-Col6b]